MPHADWFTVKLVKPRMGNAKAYGNKVTVHTPWRRYPIDGQQKDSLPDRYIRCHSRSTSQA